jgi:hypothetical protein
VDPTSLVAGFNVYPNPTACAFTVEIANTTASDLTITLTNIQGQVVYQNRVANVIDHQETIDTELSKSLYFLTVNNGKEVKVQKVVVQQSCEQIDIEESRGDAPAFFPKLTW